MRLEEKFRASKSLVINADNFSIGQLVLFIEFGAILGHFESFLVVLSYEAKFLLNVSHNFHF